MKQVYNGPFIIGLSVGIGNSVTEAQIALKKAKSLKEKVTKGKPIKVRFNGDYCISTYKGEPQNDELIHLEDLEKDTKKLNKWKEKDAEAYNDILELIERKKIDDSTGALTPYGYQFELRSISEKEMKEHEKIPKRKILFFDGNNMHHWNDLAIYDEVTKHLSAIGTGLKNDTHKVETGERYSDLVTRINENNPLVHRIHGSAGDEFVVNVRCAENQLVPLAERLIKSSYIAQANIYCGKQREQLESMLGVSF